MALVIYPLALREILKGNIDFDAPNDFRVLLLKSSAAYTATHEFVANVIAGSSEISSVGYSRQALTAEVVTFTTPSAFFDAADVSFTSLASGQTIGSIILYKFVTSDADSPVIAWIDGSILPLATANGTVTFTWNASGILKLT